MTKILFVCHGNICRSPMAEFILKDMIRRDGLESEIYVESAAATTEEIGRDSDGNVKYQTTIVVKVDYIQEDEKTVTGYDVYNYVFTVNATGLVQSDNSQSGLYSMLYRPYGELFAQEIINTARAQVSGALEGRTTEGVYRELVIHYKFFHLRLLTSSSDITHMGSSKADGAEYDSNARFFEDPWNNRDIPRGILKGEFDKIVKKVFLIN